MYKCSVEAVAMSEGIFDISINPRAQIFLLQGFSIEGNTIRKCTCSE